MGSQKDMLLEVFVRGIITYFVVLSMGIVHGTGIGQVSYLKITYMLKVSST